MNNETTILLGNEAKEALFSGFNKVANAVTVTLGPKGKNVLIQRNRETFLTKDGATVARNIVLSNNVEQVGGDFVKNLTIMAESNGGDGTTTATLLAQSILDIISIKEENNQNFLIDQLDHLETKVTEFLNEKSVPVNEKTLKSVCVVSANNDHEIGDLVYKACSMTSDGNVSLKPSIDDYRIEQSSGFKLKSGYASSGFKTSDKSCHLNNVWTIIYDGDIKSYNQIIDVIEYFIRVTNNEKLVNSLAIIANDIDEECLKSLVSIKNKGSLNVVVIKAPDFNDKRESILKDLGAYLGCPVFNKDNFNFKQDDIEKLGIGFCKSLLATHDTCMIIEPVYDEEESIAYEKHIDNLNKLLDEETEDYQKTVYQERLDRLQGVLVTIHVKSDTQIEWSEKKTRIEDAIQAYRSAKKTGILPGGGKALLDSSSVVLSNFFQSVLKRPFYKIMTNGGFDEKYIKEIADSSRLKGFNFGYDGINNQVVDMVENSIVDPTGVVISSLKSAISLSKLFITTGCVISEIED